MNVGRWRGPKFLNNRGRGRPKNNQPKPMTRTKRNLIVAAAITGLLTGVVAKSYGDDTNSTGSSASSKDSSKHDCKGKNDCKGKGGCKTDNNSCKGQNDCKGKGGCKS